MLNGIQVALSKKITLNVWTFSIFLSKLKLQYHASLFFYKQATKFNNPESKHWCAFWKWVADTVFNFVFSLLCQLLNSKILTIFFCLISSVNNRSSCATGSFVGYVVLQILQFCHSFNILTRFKHLRFFFPKACSQSQGKIKYYLCFDKNRCLGGEKGL